MTSEGIGKGSSFSVQLPATSKRANSVAEMCPGLDKKTSLTRKAESIPSRIKFQFRLWFGLKCFKNILGYLKRCIVVAEVKVCPDDKLDGAFSLDANMTGGCNRDISSGHIHKRNNLQLEDSFVRKSEEEDNVNNHLHNKEEDFDEHSVRRNSNNAVDEKRDDDTVTLIDHSKR